MRSEIESAANFLSELLLKQSRAPPLVEQFRRDVIGRLQANYERHWFPDRPFKGSAYRCLRINHKMDPTLAAAGRTCGLSDDALKALLPHELTLWVDPQEVCYRIGENGSICVIYGRGAQPPMPCLAPSPTPSSLSSTASSVASSPSSSPNWFHLARDSPPKDNQFYAVLS